MKKNIIKSPEQIEIMAEGGHILALILREMAMHAVAGVSTKELDCLAEKLCNIYNVIPACKGYHGFPASYCSCVNDVIQHGIPNEHEILKNGDIITIDMVVKYKGLHTDAALTVPVGEITPEIRKFLDTVKRSRDKAIEKVKPGRYVGDLSAIMEFTVRSEGYSPVTQMVGHGIGLEMHEEPEVPCYGIPGTGMKLQEGMTLAIEAIIAMGDGDIVISKQDGWTTRTKDHSLGAVFEHTVAITKNGYRILTQ